MDKYSLRKNGSRTLLHTRLASTSQLDEYVTEQVLSPRRSQIGKTLFNGHRRQKKKEKERTRKKYDKQAKHASCWCGIPRETVLARGPCRMTSRVVYARQVVLKIARVSSGGVLK